MKVMIMDDEILARDILKNQLNQFHYQDIVMADNGREGLELLERELPDLVFVDICMPEMSGIEFMEKAAALNKQFVFIILSGHNRFEYAQRTMELGAYNYLLKPIDDKKLKEALDSVEEKLKVIRINQERYAALHKSRTKDRSLLRKQYIYEVVSGNCNPMKYSNAYVEAPAIFKKNCFQICCFTVREERDEELGREDQGMIQFVIENIVTEIAAEHGMDSYFFSDSNTRGILVNYNNPCDQRVIFEQMFENVLKYAAHFRQTEITFGVGKEVTGLEKIQDAYSSARDTVKMQLILGGGRIYFASESPSNDRIKSDTGDGGRLLEEDVIRSIYQGDMGQVKRNVDALYAPFLNLLLADIKKLNKMHLNLFVLLHKELEKMEVDSYSILDNEFSLYNKIQSFDTIEEMKEFLLQNILLCMEALERKTGIGNEKIIMRAKDYISQNMGFNLTLESVAEHVNFSPAYFSKFFKNEEGMNFIDYVNKTRIEEAKKLLDKNMKTADICDRIGFSDSKHFYKIFKRWEGITPGQYKKGIYKNL